MHALRRIPALLLTGLLGLAAPAQMPEAKPRPSSAAAHLLEGTVWTGQDSDGTLMTVTFARGGRLKYTSQDPGSEPRSFDDPEDLWAQNGTNLLMVTSNFATRVGTLDGDRITGLAWNVRGDRWTWTLTRAR